MKTGFWRIINYMLLKQEFWIKTTHNKPTFQSHWIEFHSLTNSMMFTLANKYNFQIILFRTLKNNTVEFFYCNLNTCIVWLSTRSFNLWMDSIFLLNIFFYDYFVLSHSSMMTHSDDKHWLPLNTWTYWNPILFLKW